MTKKKGSSGSYTFWGTVIAGLLGLAGIMIQQGCFDGVQTPDSPPSKYEEAVKAGQGRG